MAKNQKSEGKNFKNEVKSKESAPAQVQSGKNQKRR